MPFNNNQHNDKLGSMVNSLASVNKSLLDMLQISDNEFGRLERFEAQFKSIRDKYSQFKDKAMDHDKRANELEIRLQQELKKHRPIEDLRHMNANLKRAIDEQRLENEKLDRDLKEIGTFNYYGNDHSSAYANAFSIISSPNQTVQRGDSFSNPDLVASLYCPRGHCPL